MLVYTAFCVFHFLFIVFNVVPENVLKIQKLRTKSRKRTHTHTHIYTFTDNQTDKFIWVLSTYFYILYLYRIKYLCGQRAHLN